jgi:rhomboid protease GluP
LLGPLRIPILSGGSLTVGSSAAIFALLGAVVYYGRRAGSSAAGGMAWQYALIMFVMGLMMPGVDNYAHAGGFAGGYLTGRILDPLKPERVNHLLGAVVCLLLSVLSIIFSVVDWVFLR